MTIFAVKGWGIKLVIDHELIVKKWKFKNFDQILCYIPQKRAKNMKNSNLDEKSMIYCKKFQKNWFSKFLMLECSKMFFAIFQIFKIFFKKWPQWNLTNVERNKVMKFELHWSIHWGVTRDIPPRGVCWTPSVE